MDTEDDKYVQFPCSEYVANEQTSVLKIRAKNVATSAIKISPENLHHDGKELSLCKYHRKWEKQFTVTNWKLSPEEQSYGLFGTSIVILYTGPQSLPRNFGLRTSYPARC